MDIHVNLNPNEKWGTETLKGDGDKDGVKF